MFILTQSSKPTYGGHAFPSSSCQTEFDGKVDSLTRQPSLGGLSMGMRRNSSNLSQISSQDLCSADATQVEFDFQSMTSSVFSVTIQTPTGETTTLQLNESGRSAVFTPTLSGCGHGIWTITICKPLKNSVMVTSMETMQLDGVGTLFFTVGDDLKPHLSGQEFLSMSGLCPKHRH